MNKKLLYALTGEDVSILKDALHGPLIGMTFTGGPRVPRIAHAANALTPATVDDLGDAAIERMCKAYYEAGADKLDDTIRPQWDRLVRASPDIAQVYREHVSSALDALLGGEQE